MQKRTKKIIIGLSIFTVVTMGLGKYFDSRCEKGCIGEAMAENAATGLKGMEKWDIHIDQNSITFNDRDDATNRININLGDKDEDIGNDEDNPRRVKEALKASYAAKDLKKIQIRSYITDWKVTEAADDKVTLVFKGYLPEKEWTIKESPGVLDVELKKKGPLHGELQVPKDFKGSIFLGGVSGDVEVEKVANAEELHVTTVSGDVKIQAAPAQKLSLNSVSGEIALDPARVSKDLKIDVNTVSGDLRTQLKASIQSLKVTSVSGDFTLKVSKGVGFRFEMEGVNASFNDLPKGSTRVDEFAHRGAKGEFGPDPRGTLGFTSVSGDFQLETAE